MGREWSHETIESSGRRAAGRQCDARSRVRLEHFVVDVLDVEDLDVLDVVCQGAEGHHDRHPLCDDGELRHLVGAGVRGPEVLDPRGERFRRRLRQGVQKKKIPLKLVSYNDQSSASTAASLYTQLITQDHVDVFVSDFGSVLTAPAVTIAEEHKQLLFDVSGSGTTFFSPSNKYIVLTSLPVSSVWPKPAIEFLHAEGIKRVGIIYCSNDFDASQATTFKKGLSAAGVKVVYYQSVPTSTSSYTTLIQDVAAKRPQAVLELGYPNNDIAFLKQLHASGVHFNMVFTAFPGQLHHLLESNVGEAGMAYVYSYGFPPQLVHNDVNVGLGTTAFLKAFESYANTKNVNFLDVAGYNAGIAIQEALANATTFSQLGMRDALVNASSPIKTIEGSFKLNSEGAQIGESLPVSQMMPSSNGSNTKITIVYPSSVANGKAKYPAP